MFDNRFVKLLSLACVYFTPIVVSATHRSNSLLRDNRDNLQVKSSIDKLKKCLVHHTQNSCQEASQKDHCEWCEVKGGNGLCMPSMYAIAAQCDKWEDLDTTCILKVTENDPQTACQDGQDQEGRACIWCHSWLGEICLDQTQTETAGTILGCQKGSILT